MFLSSLNTLDISPLSYVWLVKIFSYSVDGSLVQNLLSFVRYHLLSILVPVVAVLTAQKVFFCAKDVQSYYSLYRLQIYFMLSSLIYLEVRFV